MEYTDENFRVIVMVDKNYNPVSRRNLFILQNARHDFEQEHMAEQGPYISSVIYQAIDIQKAYEDAIWAGMAELQAPQIDPLTNVLTAYLREPCGGNVLMLTEHFAPDA